MNLIRYHAPNSAPWSALDRWISGERKRESNNGETAQRTERYVGTFRRSVALPTRVDASKVSATYQDGILKVTLSKAEEAKPKQIQVS
jgi:HSP20 family protein